VATCRVGRLAAGAAPQRDVRGDRKRLITSNLRVDNWPFVDAMDLHTALGHDLRASTAAHNSARFSWVSPAGTILDPSGRQHGHVLDGATSRTTAR